jgi:hypothetical protein
MAAQISTMDYVLYGLAALLVAYLLWEGLKNKKDPMLYE